MNKSLKLQAPLFSAFLKGAENIRISAPWPKERPNARIIRFTKDGEEHAAAYDMETQLACVMTLEDLKQESAALD